jgi:hypothetical protein
MTLVPRYHPARMRRPATLAAARPLLAVYRPLPRCALLTSPQASVLSHGSGASSGSDLRRLCTYRRLSGQLRDPVLLPVNATTLKLWADLTEK